MRSKFLIALAGCALAASLGTAQTFSEIRTNEPGTDVNSFFELACTPSQDLGALNLTVFVISDCSSCAGGFPDTWGRIDNGSKVPVSGTCPADGLFLACMGSDVTVPAGGQSPGTYPCDQSFGGDFGESSDNLTIVLAQNFVDGGSDMDVDTNDDGNIDNPSWGTIFDSVCVQDAGGQPVDTNGASRRMYCNDTGGETVGPDGSFPPAHITRWPDASTWTIGSFGLDSGIDTPGFGNLPVKLSKFEVE